MTSMIDYIFVNNASTFSDGQSRTIFSEPGSIRPALCPIEMAVYFLSPVSIHTIILASFSSVIVSATLSCSLSSMAVIPTRSNSLYISDCSYSIFYWRFSVIEANAFSYLLFHSSYEFIGIYFWASINVRNPIMAYFCND
jgi:hypothetical protein